MALFGSKKQIDQQTIDTVNGYIRDKQELLPYEENSYYIIPSLVIHLILSYYIEPEYFTNNPGGYKVSDDKKTITKIDASEPSIYGNIIIPSTRKGIYSWIFKILCIKTNTSFGITSDIDCTYKGGEFWQTSKFPAYAAVYAGHRASKGKMEYEYPEFNQIRANSMIKMVLDLSKKELIFWVDNQNLGVAYKDIDVGEDIKYRMAVDMYNASTKMCLIDYNEYYE